MTAEKPATMSGTRRWAGRRLPPSFRARRASCI